jgi:hypothetical protein
MRDGTDCSPHSSAAEATPSDPEFNAIRATLQSAGPESALRQLIERLDGAGEYRPLLDALLLKARHDLGLPAIQVGSLSDLAEPVRSRYEERYVEAIRLVGSRFLDAGEIPTAWAYFRAIGEPEAVAAALDGFQAGDDPERLAQVIDVAFHQGANLRRGFELILEHYGTCSAITALEQAPFTDAETQRGCIEHLIRHLHGQLAANLRADLRQRGTAVAPDSTSITQLVTAHPELFADEAYHTDVSHLAACVRYSIMVNDPSVLALAADLAEYGRRLSPRLQFEGAPPFEHTFEDHLKFLRALLRQDADAAVAQFRAKAEESTGNDVESSVPSQVLVNLLVRLGRLDDAIDEASRRLAGFPDAALSCPGVAELCLRAGRMDRLEAIAQAHGNLVQFLAAQL